jgi:hypothetical protein
MSKPQEWECPECKTRYVKNIGKCGDLTGCSRPNVVPVSEQPQEWTVNYVWEQFSRGGVLQIKKLVAAHNAALAAEREKARLIKTAWDDAAIEIGTLRQQLAAEREKNWTHVAVARELECELAAEREKIGTLVEAMEEIQTFKQWDRTHPYSQIAAIASAALTKVKEAK